jgi:hypothetical protein
MDEEKQMSVGFDVEMADETIVQVVMIFKVYADLRHSLALDRVKSFDIQQIVNSFRAQIEDALRDPLSSTEIKDKTDG